jgi:hypothetical protein
MTTQLPVAVIPWERFKAVIVTRHSVPAIYETCRRILDLIPYPKVAIPSANTLAHLYIHQCLFDFPQYDWVINVDDDAFLTDPAALYELLDYMDREGYDYSGMPDGLTYTPRDIFNPCSDNPFFGVYHVKSIWSKMTPEMLYGERYHPSLLEKMDFTKLHPEIMKRNQETIHTIPFSPNGEPFYPQFFGLLRHCRHLQLYGQSFYYDENGKRIGILYPEDPYTTILYNHENKPFLVHTWYARSYYQSMDHTTPPNNKERIDRMALYALRKVGK